MEGIKLLRRVCCLLPIELSIERHLIVLKLKQWDDEKFLFFLTEVFPHTYTLTITYL
jgi:hypothetical protein